MKLHTIHVYQKPGPSGFRQDFYPTSPYEMLAPGPGFFLPQGYNFYNLGRGPLDEVLMYQISKAGSFYSQIRRFLIFFPYMSLC